MVQSFRMNWIKPAIAIALFALPLIGSSPGTRDTSSIRRHHNRNWNFS
jgi:hypothetical protein